ncbi:hypothetical protein V2G26_006997 [Clonostachys chloroleuca]
MKASNSSLALCLLATASCSASANPEYDYVVIGSGAGGGPLAANLARHGYSVLLLEAGGDHVNSSLTTIPVMANTAAEDPEISWQFFVNHYSDPDKAQKDSKFTWQLTNGSYYVGYNPPPDAKARGMLYPRGATVGGSTMVNAAGLALPPDNDWNHIANLTGDNSWKSENMRQYFERLESNHFLPKDTPGHGFSGWLGSNRNNLSIVRPDDGFFQVVSTAMTALGDSHNPSKDEVWKLLHRDGNSLDGNRFEKNRITEHTLHHDQKHRRSSPGTYLKSTIDETYSNGTQKYLLTISTNSLATKLLFNNSTDVKSVVGVEYLKGVALYKADPRSNEADSGSAMAAVAKREVIVAGGAFNTPQILKLSGIGPQAELEEFSIPVQVPLPAVGTNLQDNYEIGVEGLASKDFFNTFENCTTAFAPGDPCFDEFMETGTGPYTQGPMLSLLMRSSQSENTDADLWFFGGANGVFRGFWPGWSNATAPVSNFWWSIVKMQMQNRAGTVTLRSADPRDVPEINFNYFPEGRDSDLAALVEGMELALDIFGKVEAPWAPFNVTRPIQSLEEEAKYESWGHHASCSCPMGIDQDTSCVDSRFRVHGVENLRIVDGSVFPRVPGGFPVAATFMISEKATDVILEDARKLAK